MDYLKYTILIFCIAQVVFSFQLFQNTAEHTTPLSLYECLPHLRAVLAEKTQDFSSISMGRGDARRPMSVLVAEKTSDKWTPPSELHIVESLPAAYSGLILLATSTAYAKFARDFYETAARNSVGLYLIYHIMPCSVYYFAGRVLFFIFISILCIDSPKQ